MGNLIKLYFSMEFRIQATLLPLFSLVISPHFPLKVEYIVNFCSRHVLYMKHHHLPIAPVKFLVMLLDTSQGHF